MTESLKKCNPEKIYMLTQKGYSYEVYIDRIDNNKLYPHNKQKGIPQDKIITAKTDIKFWNGSRWFATEELMRDIIHEETMASLANTPKSEDIIQFWKEWNNNHPNL